MPRTHNRTVSKQQLILLIDVIIKWKLKLQIKDIIKQYNIIQYNSEDKTVKSQSTCHRDNNGAKTEGEPQRQQPVKLKPQNRRDN